MKKLYIFQLYINLILNKKVIFISKIIKSIKFTIKIKSLSILKANKDSLIKI